MSDLKQIAASVPPPRDSLPALKNLTPPGVAVERALLMFGCYRKGDAHDPDTYAAAISSILAEYPEAVVRYVTDPRTGIPRKLKFLPSVAEVAEACDHEWGLRKVIGEAKLAQFRAGKS